MFNVKKFIKILNLFNKLNFNVLRFLNTILFHRDDRKFRRFLLNFLNFIFKNLVQRDDFTEIIEQKRKFTLFFFCC